MYYPMTGGQLLPSSGTVKRAVMLLHGVGSNGDDLISLAPMLASVLPDTVFLSPNAPFAFDMAPVGYQWFSLADRSPHVMLEGVKAANPIVQQWLDEVLLSYELQPNELALVGFSQGTMMSLFAGLRRSAPLAGIVGFSGAMIGGDVPEHPFTSPCPVCLIHGEQDDVVPFSAMAHAASMLSRANIPHTTHARPNLGHSIDMEGMEDTMVFLQKCFGLI